LADINKCPHYKILQKFKQCEPSFSITDMMAVVVVFCNFKNMPKN